MWGRIDVMIDIREESVTIEVFYDTGREVHTVAKSSFKTLATIDHTIEPSFATN